MIATNTIAQGDTRTSGLQPLVAKGLDIYEATRSLLWPGESAVVVAMVHLAKGAVRDRIDQRHMDGRSCVAINSRLRPRPERPDPESLIANSGLSFVGSFVNGIGFILAPEEREKLTARDARNVERIFPYLGGEEVNTSPTQSFHRYVIDFGDMDLHAAEQWPELVEIVRGRVKPERDRVKRDAHRKFWWQYGDKRPSLYHAIRSLSRCLITARVTKHLCFSYQPTDRVFNEKLVVFPFERFTQFSILQSSIGTSSCVLGNVR